MTVRRSEVSGYKERKKRSLAPQLKTTEQTWEYRKAEVEGIESQLWERGGGVSAPLGNNRQSIQLNRDIAPHTDSGNW